MGIFSNLNPLSFDIPKKKPLNELTIGEEKLDDDGEDFSVDNETSEGSETENSASENEPVSSEAGSDDGEGEDTDDNFELPDNEESTSEPESTEDADNTSGGDGEEPDDSFEMGDGTDDTEPVEPDGDGQSTGAEPSDEEADQSESQLYDTLSDDQKKIRILQLKINFQNLYREADSVLNAINNIPKSDSNIETLRRLIDTLNNVKQYVLDYVTRSYDSTTYLDNNQVYIKFIGVFRTIRKVIDDLAKEQNLNN